MILLDRAKFLICYWVLVLDSRMLMIAGFTPILAFPHQGGRDFFCYPRLASVRGKGVSIDIDLRYFTPILAFPRQGGRDFFLS